MSYKQDIIKPKLKMYVFDEGNADDFTFCKILRNSTYLQV